MVRYFENICYFLVGGGGAGGWEPGGERGGNSVEGGRKESS